MIRSGQSAALTMERRAVERLRRFPRERTAFVDALRVALALLVRALLRLYLRFEIVGKENLPHDPQSFVLVANHASHLDSVCLLLALPLRRLPRTFPVAAEDYFFRSLARTWLAAILMNALPFGRQMRVRESLATCRQLLAQPGNVLIIFPEGTRSRDGEMRSFKPGVGALVAGREVNVLPCYLEGAFRVWPKGRRFPRPGKVRLIIGRARQFAEEAAADMVAAELRLAVEDLKHGRA